MPPEGYFDYLDMVSEKFEIPVSFFYNGSAAAYSVGIKAEPEFTDFEVVESTLMNQNETEFFK